MPSSTIPRLRSIDILRGIVMVIMALDHVRDFFHHDAALFDPTDMAQTNPLLFFTRWITHFCAPVFVFLAGSGISLQLARGKPKVEVSKFLLTRGLWLVVLELTLVRFGWTFNFNYSTFVFGQVIWVLGWSMVIHAALIYCSLRTVALTGIVMILIHNLFDGITPGQLGQFGDLWSALHVQGPITPFGGTWQFFIIYPLIPWLGVMSVGYAFGALVARPADNTVLSDERRRKRKLLWLGTGVTAIFLILRAPNIYGEPHPWNGQQSWPMTVVSFFNTTKYPPSLQFLLMTLGPSIALLPYLEKWSGRLAGWLSTFGRVPLFYYIIHIPFAHFLVALYGFAKYGSKVLEFGPGNVPPDWGVNLGWVYVTWIGVIASLYPLCAWYARLKQRSNARWLSYL